MRGNVSEYGIVFSGGGALGSWEVGCYEEILETRGKKPLVVTGASAGALNAAAVTAEMSVTDLVGLWNDLETKDVYLPRLSKFSYFKRVVHFLYNWQIRRRKSRLSFEAAFRKAFGNQDSLFDTSPLRDTLRQKLGPREKAFFNSPIRFGASLTNLEAKTCLVAYKPCDGLHLPAEWMSIDSIEFLFDILIGTTALPVLFPPAKGFFDGGILRNQPVRAASILGVSEIFVLIPSPKQIETTIDLLGIAQTSLETWLVSGLEWQISVNQVENRVRKIAKKPEVKLYYIRPIVDLPARYNSGLLAFGKNVKKLIDDGRITTRERLKEIDPTNPETWA